MVYMNVETWIPFMNAKKSHGSHGEMLKITHTHTKKPLKIYYIKVKVCNQISFINVLKIIFEHEKTLKKSTKKWKIA